MFFTFYYIKPDKLKAKLNNIHCYITYIYVCIAYVFGFWSFLYCLLQKCITQKRNVSFINEKGYVLCA